MAYPTPVVQIAFNDGPYVVSPTWTDISSDVYSMTTERGRSDDWGTFYGSATVTLDNRARTYDPFNTSSPYWDNVNNRTKLTPRRQIRILAIDPNTMVAHPVFRGFVNGWPPVWTAAGQDSTVTLSCFDAMGLLASDAQPVDWSRSYILSTAPRHYWPCDEPVTPFVAGGVQTDYGSVPFNFATTVNASSGDQLATGLVNSSVQGTGGFAANTASGAVQGVGNFSASMWIVPDVETTFGSGGVLYNTVWSVEYDAPSSRYQIYMLDYNSNVQRIWQTTPNYDSSTPRMLSFTFNGTSKAMAIWVDGVSQAVTTIAPTGIFGFTVNEGYYLGSGQTQQFIVWDGIQTQAVFQEIFKYSTVAFSESTAARFNRLIGQTSFPSGMTSAPSAPASTVLEITDDAPMTTAELQKVADSEYAPLFVTRAGVLTLYNQNQIRTQTRSIVSQGTYGTGGYAIGQNVAIAYDGDSMRNEADVTMSQGGVYTKKNTSSINTYGAAEASVETQVASLANAVQIGDIVTGWGGQVYPKADPVEVVLSPDGDWSNALDRELNDRITLVVSPPTGNAITTPMLLSRITHSVVPGQWTTTFEGSARWAAVFILNQSRLNGTDLLG
jgi:hypothetical protein